jgi:uncharacterized protein with HEPN domain
MRPNRDIASLADMCEAARDVLEFTKGKTYEDYLASKLLQAAVGRKVEIMGEAARRVSADFKSAHPQISWKPIMIQRHIVAHDYDNVRHERIWRVVTIHAANLVQLIEPLLPPPPGEIDIK